MSAAASVSGCAAYQSRKKDSPARSGAYAPEGREDLVEPAKPAALDKAIADRLRRALRSGRIAPQQTIPAHEDHPLMIQRTCILP